MLLQNDYVKVEFIRLGEGYNGEFDPSNPEDEELYRLDIFVDKTGKGHFNEASESRCTCIAVSSPEKEVIAKLKAVYDRVQNALAKGENLSDVADELSYMY